MLISTVIKKIIIKQWRKQEMKGTVKFFSNTKGWGFITCEDGKDVFVHYTGILMEGRKTLNQNDVVEFEIGEGKDGISQAVNVKRQLSVNEDGSVTAYDAELNQ